MQNEKEERSQQTDSTQFDNGWWDFILSDEPARQTGSHELHIPHGYPQGTENAWGYIKKTYDNDEIIDVMIYSYNKGGLLAKGPYIQGFIPISHIMQLDISHSSDAIIEHLQSRVGSRTRVKVIECTPALNKVVLSERAALTENGQRRELISQLKANQVVTGRVTNITNFGIFVDLGGIEGLIHISELSWGRVRNPSDFVKLDEMISVLILTVDEREMHVALSLKRLEPNPWLDIENKYKPGDRVMVRISKILPYGAFAHMQEGVEGLIHISTFKMDDNIRDLNKILEVDQQVTVEILHIDSVKHRLGLALVAIN